MWTGLAQHHTVHRERRPYLHGDCGKALGQECNLPGHQLGRSRERPCMCTQCGRVFWWLSGSSTQQTLHLTGRSTSVAAAGKASAVWASSHGSRGEDSQHPMYPDPRPGPGAVVAPDNLWGGSLPGPGVAGKPVSPPGPLSGPTGPWPHWRRPLRA